MKLSKECIEAIKEYSITLGNLSIRHGYTLGATEALTNASIYEKAGLISLEDALGFAEWVDDSSYMLNSDIGKWHKFIDDYEDKSYTTAQLFQIYQEQKEK